MIKIKWNDVSISFDIVDNVKRLSKSSVIYICITTLIFTSLEPRLMLYNENEHKCNSIATALPATASSTTRQFLNIYWQFHFCNLHSCCVLRNWRKGGITSPSTINLSFAISFGTSSVCNSSGCSYHDKHKHVGR